MFLQNTRLLAFTAILGFPLFTFAQTPFACTGQFYISFTTPQTSSIVEAIIDPLTQDVEFVNINANLGTFINAMGYRFTDNLIYCVHPVARNLYQIDGNGTIRSLAILQLNPDHAYLAGDISPDGRYLVIIGTPNRSSDDHDRELVLIDLEDPAFTVTSRPLSGPQVRMLDIAFDPTDGTLYGVDARESMLVTIDFNTAVVTASYPSTPVMDLAGSLFFDSFGDLYAYGGPREAQGIQNTLYKVDKVSGDFEVLAHGPDAIATDGCSCPHTVELRKEVFPRAMVPCGEVRYRFTISNSSSVEQTGIDFFDVLPPGFTIEEILYNPYGGDIVSGEGSSVLDIRDITLLPGIDSIIVRVSIGDLPAGIYKNQAELTNLPQALGLFVLSDDPVTIVKNDSTTLLLHTFSSEVVETHRVCRGEEALLDATGYGITFNWSTGSSAHMIGVTDAGRYTVLASTGCDTVVVHFDVEVADISVAFFPDRYEILLGDSILLSPVIFNDGMEVFYHWVAPEGTFLPCPDCPQNVARPFNDTEYILFVENELGCMNSAPVTVLVDRTRSHFTPNVFSPNGDGINDIFFLQVRGFAGINRFRVFDRWGDLLAEDRAPFTSNPRVTWDGRMGIREMMPGVYVWMAEIVYFDGLTDVISGDITLVR